MTLGLIISAGKESRFESIRPKSLSMVNEKCLLDHNIALLKNHCDVVYTICSKENEHWFNKYDKKIIESGGGCGYAVYQALKLFDLVKYNHVFISWGDCILQEKVLLKLKNNKLDSSIVIPCTFEQNPYVSLKNNKDGIDVKFSRYGEFVDGGYHDFGVFMGHSNEILTSLTQLHSKVFKNGKPHHKHGDEMNFLDIFNETNICGELLIIEDCKSLSFNTVQELKKIKL